MTNKIKDIDKARFCNLIPPNLGALSVTVCGKNQKTWPCCNFKSLHAVAKHDQ